MRTVENRWQLLRAVSRSFYLSVRFLPGPMREPVALGYLLARASDTLADTPGVPPAERVAMLEHFSSRVAGKETGQGSIRVPELEEIVHEGERVLLERANELLAWLESLEVRRRQLVRDVVKTIVEGQTWDLGHFGEAESGGCPAACPDAVTLDRYTYAVAGCVGEFWTRIGFISLGERFADPGKEDLLLEKGRRLGQGLQLVNILRDIHEDIPQGRCYLPADELREAGWNEGTDLSADQLGPVWTSWLAVCREHLGEGHHYVRQLRNRRVRFSTKLPLRLAEETADLLEQSGPARALRGKVKVDRRVVRRAIWESLW